MKEALVVISFGTSVPEARAGITAVEEALAQAVPAGTPVRRAFTSGMIRRILADGGVAPFVLAGYGVCMVLLFDDKEDICNTPINWAYLMRGWVMFL